LITTIGATLIEDARITSYELNVTLPEKLFRK
jgi:hypothetical protein